MVGIMSIFLNYVFVFVKKKGKNFLEKAKVVLFICIVTSLSTMHITTASTSIRRVKAIHQIIGILEEVHAVLNIPLGMDFGLSDLLSCSLNLLVIFCHCYNHLEFIYSFLSFIVVTNVWLAMSQFSVLASLINNRLEGACEFLDELKLRSDSPYKDQKVAILSDVHNKLCDAGEILHTAFTGLLTLLVASSFVGIILPTFCLYDAQKLIFCLWVGLQAVFLHYLFIFVKRRGGKYVEKAELVLLVCFTTGLSIVHITTAGTSVWRVRAVRQIIGILEEVDAILSIRLKMDFGLSDLTAISLNFFIFVWLSRRTKRIIYAMFSFIVVTTVWLAMSQFSVFASLINRRLEGACESLDELKMRSDSPYKDQKVAILFDVHNKLCDAGEILHTAFSCIMTIMIAMCFVGIIVPTFYLYTVQKRNGYFDIHLLLLRDETVLWIAFFFTITWKLAVSSSELTQKVIKLS
ncbi:unnamed protein product [Nezara viridula]|uniref:Gustatory receptor n=1 Tax=Nezara viridula TaxID=85310 RepID=A0A9P0H991_NEZVI|nr:unnamed protein product [Nezara viridula]